MVYTIIVCCLVGIALYLLIRFCKKYKTNPFRLIMIFGKKGSGKSSYLVKIAQKALKKGTPVFSTEEIPGCYKISPSDIGYVFFPPGSLILIDEIGLVWHSRDFKNFDPKVRAYFKLQRHYKHTVVCASQSWDIDKSLRELCDELYLFTNPFGWLSYGKQIKRKIVVVKASADSESRIADELIIPPFILSIFGARKFTFIPRWSKYFNSFDVPMLPHKDFPIIPYKQVESSSKINFFVKAASKISGKDKGVNP